MENTANLDNILDEVKTYPERPTGYKARPMTEKERKDLEARKKETPRFMTLEERKKQKALWRICFRIGFGCGIAAGAVLAEAAGLMDVRLALPVGAAALAFTAFWVGAGAQWKFGGLIDG